MADEKTDGTNGTNGLNGAGGGESAPPPKVRINIPRTNGSKKDESARIDLSEAEPLDLPAAGGGEALSVREVLGTAPQTEVRSPPPQVPPKVKTTRVSIHDSQPIQPGEAVPMARSATSRISIRDSQRVAAGEAGGIPKAATSPVPAAGTAEDVARQGALGRTARIMIDGPDDALPSGGSLGDTGRMTIPEEAIEGAVAPKTIRIQRPSAPPKTVILKRPDGAARAAATEPKTVQLSREGGEAKGGGEKGATARISVPDGALTAAPPTQRKTIRIKRAEGPPTAGGAKTVVVHRPHRPVRTEAAAGEEGEAAAVELGRALGVPEVDEPGIGYLLVALLTLFILGALVYILLAQTFMQTLPLPGRMV